MPALSPRHFFEGRKDERCLPWRQSLLVNLPLDPATLLTQPGAFALWQEQIGYTWTVACLHTEACFVCCDLAGDERKCP